MSFVVLCVRYDVGVHVVFNIDCAVAVYGICYIGVKYRQFAVGGEGNLSVYDCFAAVSVV